MLTKEQWQDAARFMGLTFIDMMADGVPIVRERGNGNMTWMPHEDWRDFGPLLRKLKRWLGSYPKDKRFPTMEVYEAYQRFSMDEYYEIDDSQFMHAGLLLAAAIGKTMREEAQQCR